RRDTADGEAGRLAHIGGIGAIEALAENGGDLLLIDAVLVSPANARRHYTVCPPSMTMAWPMTKAASSEHSQTTAAAISSGFPIRPTGSCAITLSCPSGVPPVNRCIIGVSMIPGHTAFTRMFDCA